MNIPTIEEQNREPQRKRVAQNNSLDGLEFLAGMGTGVVVSHVVRNWFGNKECRDCAGDGILHHGDRGANVVFHVVRRCPLCGGDGHL